MVNDKWSVGAIRLTIFICKVNLILYHSNMKFLKYGVIGFVLQIVLLIFLGVIGVLLPQFNPEDLVFGMHYPFVRLIIKIGSLNAEPGLLEDWLFGIVLGMFTYATVIGLVLWFSSKNKYD